MSDTVTLTIDGNELEVPKGTLIIRAAEQLGITIPRFCDHPLLDPVAACRQCLVEIEGGPPKPATACSTPCADGMVVKTHLTSQTARQAQEAQLEFLLINHPLDCPQCDKGGECPLQDQALAHGPGDSRMMDQKRRYTKPLPISSQIALDRERCVLCARCTRFSFEISGDVFIELFERGALEQVAIYADEPYHSYFSGNVVQICPVGALTASSYRFKSRPFDLRSVDGVCNQCSAGCNLRVDVRRGEIQRQLARTNMAVNEMWNCDKGRFGFEFVAGPDRLREPAVRTDGIMQPTSWFQALHRAAERIKAAVEQHGPSAVGVLTGGRLTDEDHYAIARYTRDALGTDNVDFRLAPRTGEEREVFTQIAGTLGPTYADVEAAPVVLIAGLDPKEEVPILYLRLRKAWRKHRQKIVVVGPALGSLAEITWRWAQTGAGEEAEAFGELADPHSSVLGECAQALRDAGAQAVLLAGERLAGSPGGLPAAAWLAQALGAKFAWVPRRNNARGAVDAGLVPGMLPGGRTLADPGPIAQVWNRLPSQPGLDTRQMLEQAAAGALSVLHLIGVDPARDFEDPRLARQALEKVDTLIVQDLLPTASILHADVVLPACAPAERVGSFTTWEGRRQPFPQALSPQGLSLPDWDILRQLTRALGIDLGWETAADARREAAPLMERAAGAAGIAAMDRAGTPAMRQAETPSLEGTKRALAPGGEGVPAPGPSEGALDGDYPFTVVTFDALIGRGDMLRGAKELLATARPVAVSVNRQDALRLALQDGQHVAVVGRHAQMTLPVRVTDAVVGGCVVLPRNSTALTPGELSDGRVRLEPVGENGSSNGLD
jgi:NADH-quinone oxidoreductase subunit G